MLLVEVVDITVAAEVDAEPGKRNPLEVVAVLITSIRLEPHPPPVTQVQEPLPVILLMWIGVPLATAYKDKMPTVSQVAW